ncbi:hypothetical protein C1752_10981 [Acaryochloris thomasi RCC1774]|uniref:Uncharacterized protein n=1 Tax=Acaryochloris thomasi RCC1774 TaxID=1764569 RepID=A0A2W1JHD0_9CYAN|nr:hypothetical protein [Acaryochloris thomasi]PZD70552.1 hypothetical protein C1752_10981 [Acaryochloris thomasi RCC1774]
MPEIAIADHRMNIAKILPLRHQVLRPGHRIAEVSFPEDPNEASRHYGAFDNSGQNIGCLSLFLSVWQEQSTWRLRAMAAGGNRRLAKVADGIEFI